MGGSQNDGPFLILILMRHLYLGDPKRSTILTTTHIPFCVPYHGLNRPPEPGSRLSSQRLLKAPYPELPKAVNSGIVRKSYNGVSLRFKLHLELQVARSRP